MVVITLNSYSLEPSIIPGDTTIGSGTSTQRDAPASFYYKFSYYGQFLTPTQLSAIPNGASIDRIEWEYEIPTDGTYSIANCNLTLFQVDTTYSSFTTGQQVYGYSSNDTTWNSKITNYTNVKSNFTYSLVKSSFEPNIRWRGASLDTPYTFDNTKNLIVLMKADPNAYDLGASTYPRILCDFGTFNNLSYWDRRDSSSYSNTDFVNFRTSYFPNIRIYWS